MTLPAADAPLFDPSAIEKLRKVAGDQDKGFVAEMAQLFLDETTRAIADLKTACVHDDWNGARRIAHSLKSSAATLGFMRLSGACEALEIGTRDAAAAPDGQALAASVFAEFEQAIPMLKGLS